MSFGNLSDLPWLNIGDIFYYENTFVHVWYPSLEEHQCRQSVDAVFLRFVQVVNLHERNVMLIAIVVDVLQFRKDLLALLLILVVCQ